jgi:predicted glycosyltransferase
MKKRIIFDVGHPAQVYQFKEIYRILDQKGWECLFVAKDKEITKYLLETFNLKHIILSKNKKGIVNKIKNIPLDDYRFFKIVKSFNPDFILNRFSIHSGHISWILGIPNLGFSDTEHADKLHKLTLPFINYKFTGISYYKDLGKNHFRYNGNIELFYLHNSIFVDSCNPYDLLKINKNQKYCIVRFVSWEAHHDVGVKKMSTSEKIKLISELDKKYKVFISAEGQLPGELENYKLQTQPEHMHTLLKYASLYIGEGGTMASEAACLDTPVIYTNNLPLMGYLKEEEKFGLLHHKTSFNDIMESLDVAVDTTKRDFKGFISDKISGTAYIVWFIENFPESAKIIKQNPEYQNRFL